MAENYMSGEPLEDPAGRWALPVSGAVAHFYAASGCDPVTLCGRRPLGLLFEPGNWPRCKTCLKIGGGSACG